MVEGTILKIFLRYQELLVEDLLKIPVALSLKITEHLHRLLKYLQK